jgi:hypothetical protein
MNFPNVSKQFLVGWNMLKSSKAGGNSPGSPQLRGTPRIEEWERHAVVRRARREIIQQYVASAFAVHGGKPMSTLW